VGRARDDDAEPDQEQDLGAGPVDAREEDGDHDDRPELPGHARAQHRPPQWGREQSRVGDDRDECAERRGRQRDAQQPPLGLDTRALEPDAHGQRDGDRDRPTLGAPEQRGARHLALDDLQPGEEEEEDEADGGEELDVGVRLGDVEHLGPDQDPERDLDDDRGQHQAVMEPRRDRRQARDEQDEDE
jgi:hypothetical protein